MYKTDATVDSAGLANETMRIVSKICGTKSERDSGKFIQPIWAEDDAIIKLCEAYCNYYWIETLNPDNYKHDKTKQEWVLELRKKFSNKIADEFYSLQFVKTPGAKDKSDGKLMWVNTYTKSSAEKLLMGEVTDKKFPVPEWMVRKEYLGKVDEKRFDELLTRLLTKLYIVDNFENSFKFFKLWMINAKIKRFYTIDEKFPKNPLFLTLWSPEHSIGKGYFVHLLTSEYGNLFNVSTQSPKVKDLLQKQFKGFVNDHTYLCHLDEWDSPEGNKSVDYGTLKNYVSEPKISAEHKGVDNDEDWVNHLSFILTANIDATQKLRKEMEQDRRYCSIKVVDVCKEFRNLCANNEEMRNMAREMWVTCPVEEGSLVGDVRRLLITETSMDANTEFLANVIRFGINAKYCDDDDFGKQRCRSNGTIKFGSKKELSKTYYAGEKYIGSYQNFYDMAIQKGFIEVKDYKTSHNKSYTVNFYAMHDEIEQYYKDREEEGV